MAETQLAEINLDELTNRTFYPSPLFWEDQVIYFLMLDRFSDGNESDYRDNQGQPVTGGNTPLFTLGDSGNAITNEQDASQWRNSGAVWVGGNLKGLTSKIGYLKRMGVTTLWVSPIFKQVAFQQTYHGYGIQNFLNVDPHFGTREDLKEMVEVAHANGLYVILDIILNHSGDVFSYADADRYHDAQGNPDARWDGNPYTVAGFNDKNGNPTIPYGPLQHPPSADELAGAVWPVEFQNPETFTRKGRINNWDYYPEYSEGDFFDLKDIHHGVGGLDDYQPSAALKCLCEVYKFWIAYADIDGFRVDTVKHMEPGATRYFASVIHEFTESIGKENFYMIGEITGGRVLAYTLLEETGLDAALGIDDIPDKLEYLVKGLRNPADYFGLFRNSLLIQKDSHVWFRSKVVTLFDDHDQVRKGANKARFCADPDAYKVVLNALALNALTLGIPCIYYGTEQYFDGNGDNDRYIREAMFGGKFGAFRSHDLHCFNEDNLLYQELGRILEIRRRKLPLMRGRQYLREISGPDNGVNFGIPQMFGGQIRSVVPWSRIFSDREILVAINTDYYSPRTAWITVDNELHHTGDTLTCIYSTDHSQEGTTVNVEARNGKAVLITVPAAGLVIYE
ncbi:MAG TPA: alpha-amylase family glycosyl hydrolase [Chloroflexia bacterium]|nr:alpha-amylase family glycosyl hydrolase [Chloroflexia bacterium]